MARTNEWTETLVDWVSGRLRQNRFSNLWLGGGPGADGGSSYRPIDGQLTQRHVCYDNSEDASPCSPSGFSSLVDNLRRIRYWQEPATWFGAETTSGLQIYIKPGLWYPSTTEYCAFAGGNSPTFTLPGALDRIDTVYIDPSGILHIQRGTPAVSPTITLPPIASGIPLWAVYLPPTASGVYFQVCSGYYAGQAYIERDLRPFLNLGGGAAVASGVLPASNRGAILRGGIADWEAYNVGAANEVLTNNGTDVIWSTGAINLTAGKTLVVSVNLALAGVDGKSLTIEENSILNQDLTTDASVTFADMFVPDGGTFGISGNELLTVNAAGNFTFSGITSIVVPTLTWIGINANCSWMFDSGNGDITTLVRLGVGTIVPHTTIESRNDTAFDTSYLESGQDNIMLACNLPVGIGNYGSSIVFDKLDGYGNYRRAAIVAIQTTTDKDQVGLQFFTHPGAGSGDPIVAAVIITHAGYVGIGLATPNQKLTVEGTIDLKEQAAANADVASYGQIWVKNTDPNELWFTDDTGTDMQLGVGGGALPAVAGAGYALVSDGVNSWVADQTPSWTGEHSFGAAIAFTGATGINAITIPDNLANALHIIDAGDADIYLQIVTTTGSEEVIFNAGGDDVDFTVQAVGVADALQVRGSDGQITLGVLTAGYIKSSAGGVLSVVTEVALVDLTGYAQGRIIRGDADDWGSLAHPGAAGYVLISDATDIVWDQTPAWTGEHSFAAGIAFTGASGANEVTVPDNIAIALELLDAGALEYMRIVSTDANPYFLIDPAAAGVKTGIGTAAPQGELDVSAAQPDIILTWTNTANYARYMFYENAVSRGSIQVLGSTFATVDRRYNMEFYTAHPDGDITFWPNGVEEVRFEAGGKVGIGTPTPAFLLSVSKNYVGSTYSQAINTNSGGVAGLIATSDVGHAAFQSIGSTEGATGWAGYGRMRVDAALNGLVLACGGADPIIFAVADAEKGRFHTDGKFCVNQPTPIGQVHFRSLNASAIPTLVLEQLDVSEGTIDFRASARAAISGATNSITSVRVEMNGVVYRLAVYADA